MRIGGPPTPAPAAPRYVTPAEELHDCVLEAFNDAGLLTRLALAEALEHGTTWGSLPQNVRDLFAAVTVGMGISDPQD